jgi:amino acid permease
VTELQQAIQELVSLLLNSRTGQIILAAIVVACLILVGAYFIYAT